MKVNAKLDSGLAGPGFSLRRGNYIGEMDETGVIWLTVQATNRMPSDRESGGRRLGIHAARFSYLEAVSDTVATTGKPEDKRAEIKAQIKAAEKSREESRKARS